MLISPNKFNYIFKEILEWKPGISRSGNFDIWIHPYKDNIWSTVPKSINYERYHDYARAVINNILIFTGGDNSIFEINRKIEELNTPKDDIFNDLIKLGIENSDDLTFDNGIPFYIGQDLINAYGKSISETVSIADREFIKLRHTEKGSFVIPISLPVRIGKSGGDLMQTEVSYFSKEREKISQYLEATEILGNIGKIEDKVLFSKKIIDCGLSSFIARTILHKEKGIMRFIKYKNIKSLYLTASGDSLINFKLNQNCKVDKYKKVEFEHIDVYGEEFFIELEELENEINNPEEICWENKKFIAEIMGANKIENGSKLQVRLRIMNDGAGKNLDKPLNTSKELEIRDFSTCLEAMTKGQNIVFDATIKKSKSTKGKRPKAQIELLSDIRVDYVKDPLF